MKKIYIFTPYQSLNLLLSNLLDILGYLPINVENYEKLSNNKKLNYESIFTNYTYLQNNKEFLNKFKNLIVIIPHEESYLDRETIIKSYTSKIIFFNQTLTVKNIQTLLHSIENNS